MSRQLKVIDVEFKNFLPFGNSYTTFDFQEGINLVSGRVPGKMTSNGSGKSALLEILPFTLFGRTPRGIRKDQFVNWTNKKNLVSHLRFEKNGLIYTIVRGVKPDVFEIHEDNRSIPLSLKRDQQRFLEEEILEVNFHTFCNLVYTNINAHDPLLRMAKPKKRLFLENLFDLEVFSRLHELCSRKIKNIDARLERLKISNSYLEKNIREKNREIEEIDIKISELFVEDIDDLKKQKHNIEISLEEFVKGQTDLKENIKIMKIEKEDLLKIIHEQKLKYYNITSKLDSLNKAQSYFKEANDNIKKERKRLEGLDWNAIRKELDELIDEIEHENEELKHLRKRELNIREKMASLTSAVDIDRAIIDGLEDSNICPICDSEIVSVNEVKDRRLERIENYLSDIKKIEIVLIEIKNIEDESINKIKDLEKDLKEWQRKENLWLNVTSTIERLEESLKNLSVSQSDSVNEKVTKYQELKTKLEQYLFKRQQEIIEKEEDINKLVQQEEEINKRLEELKDLNKKIEIKTAQFDQRKELEKELLLTKKKLIKSKISSEKDIENNENEKTRLVDLVDYLYYFKDVCKDEKIKQYAISSAIPYLNKRTNEYLAHVGHIFYIELDSWVDAKIKGPGITNCTYESLSGGESRSVDLSLQFAFHDVAKRLSPTFIDVMVQDEILDSSLDGPGLAKILDIVRYKQKRDGLKIYIMSHRPVIEDVDFDKVYVVEKRSGYSKLVEQ